MTDATIYYFSATGNSLWVARAIAGKLGNAKLIPLARPDAEHPSPDTPVVGIIFPVYVFGLPLIVARFIKNLKIPKDAYLFAVAVNGGMPCATLKQAARQCADQGITLSGGFAVTMVDNYTPIAGAIPVEKQKIRFDMARQRIDDVCALIGKRERSIDPGMPIVNWLFSGMYGNWVKKSPEIDRQFSVDSNCNGCGTCEKACPVGNIRITDRLPAWQHRCEQCFACLHWCPQEAIQYGKKTRGRTRYHHPEVTLKDIIVREGSDL